LRDDLSIRQVFFSGCFALAFEELIVESNFRHGLKQHSAKKSLAFGLLSVLQ
jgi:hypothetical protein